MANNTHSLDLESTSSQYASAADSGSLSIVGNFTIECWVKFESLPSSGNSMVFVAKYAASNVSYAFQLFNNAGTLQFNGITSSDGASDNNANVNWTPSTATWYHVAMVYDTGGNAKFYLDAVQQGTTQTGMGASIFDGNASAIIGSLTGVGSYFDGLIDEVRIWSSARSITEISDNKSKEISGSTSGLNAYWKLNNSYVDSTTNGNTLTASGSPVFSTDVPFTQGFGGVSNLMFGFFQV